MSVDLQSTSGEEFDINNSGWRYLLTFAKANGFSWPLADDGEEKEDLTEDQAKALADAIERGMGSGSPSEIADRVSAELTRLLVTPSKSPMFPDEPLKFSARTMDYWKHFIRFARTGGFSISA